MLFFLSENPGGGPLTKGDVHTMWK
jgi:hypothetical protein